MRYELTQISERDLVQQLSPDLLYFDSIEYVLQVSSRGSLAGR